MAEENKYNILIESGADFVLPFTWYDNNGNPYDLTGATIEGQLRETPSSTDGYDFICTHNGAGGRITITLPYEITSDISFSYGVYDVFVNMPGGGRKRPLYGEVEVQDHVTKPHDGAFLYMIGATDYESLPAEGITDRLYFVYGDRKIYRWNGSNYIATSIGNGIQSINFVEHVDTFTDKYRITFDDGTHFDYLVTTRGIDHISLIGSTGTVRTGVIDQYRIYFSDDTTHDYYVTNGRAFDVKTSYDATQAYEYLDMVKSNGATYVAVQDVPANTAITNTDYWFKIIAPLTMGTVTTVGAQELADASIGGTADAPVLNLTIPRGVTGNESIDDTKGEGDTDYVWSADKTFTELSYKRDKRDLIPTELELCEEEPIIEINDATVAKTIAYLSKPDGNNEFDLQLNYITAWGDSLTALGGWTERLASLSGMDVMNGGCGGETVRTIIARQGADAMVVNNITIPATKTAVTIAVRSTDTGINTVEGHKATPLLQTPYTHFNPCKIGDVEGTMAWTGSAWTFTRNEIGDEVVIDRPTVIRTNYDMHYNDPYLLIIYMGTNWGYSDLDELVRQHRLVMAHANAKHTIILGFSADSYADRHMYEERMQQEFGRYFISLRQYLAHPIYDVDGETIISCYGIDDAVKLGLLIDTDGNVVEEYNSDTVLYNVRNNVKYEYDYATTIAQIAEGRVPYGLTADNLHYTNATKMVIGDLIYKKCQELNIF